MYENRFKAFAGSLLEDYFKERHSEIRSRIKGEGSIVDETKYVEDLVRQFTIELPHIDFDSPDFTYESTIVCSLPYKGDVTLFTYRPSEWFGWGVEVSITGEGVRMSPDPGVSSDVQIKQNLREKIDLLQKNLKNLHRDIEAYNSQLHPFILQLVKEHKRKQEEELARKTELLESLKQSFATKEGD